MSYVRPTFTTDKAIRKLVLIVDFIKERQSATQEDLAAAIGITRQSIGRYLNYAADVLKLIHRAPREKRVGPRGQVPMEWRPGPAPRKRQPPKQAPAPAVQRDNWTAAFFGTQTKGST